MDIFEPWRNAPPARHTLESDSEEEQDPEDAYRSHASSSSSKPQKVRPVATIEWLRGSPPSEQQEVIVASEEAGMTWSEGLDTESLEVQAYLLVDGFKAASISRLTGPKTVTAVFVAASMTYEALHAVAELLLQELRPSHITIIDSYAYPSYLCSNPIKPSIRYLSTNESLNIKLERFEPPNLLQGLAAALACEAEEQDVSALILLFPSNLSDATSASVIVHSTHRQPVPDSVYDYGGPLPGSDNLLSSAENRQALTQLGESWGWASFGWRTPQLTTGGQKGRKARGSHTSQAGFGWWEEAKRAQRQTIADGGMYI